MVDETPRPTDKTPPKKPDDAGDLWKLLGLGIQLAVTVGIFAGLGWWLQEKYNWPGWTRTAISMVGVAAGLYNFLKDSLR